MAHLLSEELLRLDLPESTFEQGLPAPLQSDAPASNAGMARQKLLWMLDEFRTLLTEPTLILTPELRNPLISVHSVVRLGIAESFPLHGTTVQHLAEKLNLRESIGWSVQNATHLPVFRALASMHDRAMTFADAMQWHAMLPGFSIEYLVEAFPWSSCGETTVVDVGGGQGHVSHALIERNATVNCVVQDVPDAVSRAQTNLPEHAEGRIRFLAHDFFQEQPVKRADVYLLRLILHDWSDKYSKMIIRALIPALKPGAKIVINDRVVPGYGEAPNLVEREARSVIHEPTP
ncbi:MAG: hypothetical protein Q9160_006210 [Pyrenula sp. 1 TL-2023]